MVYFLILELESSFLVYRSILGSKKHFFKKKVISGKFGRFSGKIRAARALCGLAQSVSLRSLRFLEYSFINKLSPGHFFIFLIKVKLTIFWPFIKVKIFAHFFSHFFWKGHPLKLLIVIFSKK